MNEELKNKLKYIDELLNNDSNLNNYIDSVESSNIEVPSNLENILIKKFRKNKEKKVFMDNTIKIFKIAACTTFALIIWNTSIVNVPIIESNNKVTINSNIVHERIDNTMKNLNEFLLTPINLERNDK